MKKTVKKVSVIALSVIMLIMSVVPAFAANDTTAQVASASLESVEDHSVLDCVNRYKMDDGRFNFTIKLPEGTNTYDVTLEITRDYKGTNLFSDRLMSWSAVWDSSLTLLYTYDGSDYYELITNKFVNDGIGIKLFYRYNGTLYRATDITNGSPVEGPGYWLSA